MLRYCKMSGTVIKRRARKKRKPKSENNWIYRNQSAKAFLAQKILV
jgi:hypothetical protein